MKAIKTIMKILAALAVVAGIVYVIATYSERIVAWARKMMAAAAHFSAVIAPAAARVIARIAIAKAIATSATANANVTAAVLLKKSQKKLKRTLLLLKRLTLRVNA